MTAAASPTITQFFEALYGECQEGWLALFILPTEETNWYPVRKYKQASREAIRRAENEDVYFGIGLHKERPQTGRGKAEDVWAIPGLWCDIDLKHSTHKAENLPETIEKGEALLAEAIPHPPSIIVHSGHGMHAHWLFKEPWVFTGEEERKAAHRLSTRLQRTLKHASAQHGWACDGTHDLSRVLRPLDTWNHKEKGKAPVQVTCYKWNPEQRYNPSDFEDLPELPAFEFTATQPDDSITAAPKLQELKLPIRLKFLLQCGKDPEDPARYPSRSEALFAVVNGLVTAQYSDAVIVDVLLDPTYALSEKPTEKGRTWLLQEIQRARQKPPPRHATGFAGWGKGPSVQEAPVYGVPEQPWRESLLLKKNGEPTANITNIQLILANHPTWVEAFWWDDVRSTPMLREKALTKEDLVEISTWLGIHERLAISHIRQVEDVVVTECKKAPRDLLKIWLNTLPAWDGIPRLESWLSDVAGTDFDAYSMAVSRVLPLSMVARAMEPGCLYRYVVILEGIENTGKSSLVRALAGPGWYVELSMGLEGKEAHMMLQGAWVAEMSELDSLSRTEETRLKAFITMKEDAWIPKYSNYKVSALRRTIFVGTTNEDSYLKGQTGNTRFLPIKTQAIDVQQFLDIRDQLFAEAFQEYLKHPATWWKFDSLATERADEIRNERRVVNVYESSLKEWLEFGRFEDNRALAWREGGPLQDETSWKEIAEHFLRIESPERWKDQSMQKQVAAALKAVGWESVVAKREGKAQKVWQRKTTEPEVLL